MSNLFKLSFVLLFASIALAQAPTEKQDQYVRFKTKIINGGFENGTSNWSASGGTLTANTTLSNVRSGLRSGGWDATAASQTLTSSANTVSAGNAQVSCWFMTTATDYEFAAYDGTNKVVTQTIPASSVFQKITLNYALSSAGQLRARITSASNAAVLYVDDCFAGEADNVSAGNFATDFVSYTPGINITTNVTSSGKWRRVADGADLQLGIDFSGTPTAFSTMEIDLPAGLSFDTNKLLSTTSLKEKMCYGTYHDPAGGTTDYALKGSYVDLNTIRVRWLNDLGSLTYENNDVSNSSPATAANGTWVRLNCHALPIQGWGSQSFFNPATAFTYAAAKSPQGTFSTASATFVDVSDSSYTTSRTIYGTAEAPSTANFFGVRARNLPAGSYLVQGWGAVMHATANQSCYVQFSDGTNTAGFTTIPINGTAARNSINAFAGIFTYTSPQSDLTFRLQAKTSGGTCTLGAFDTGNEQSTIMVTPLGPQVQAPILIGGVTTGSTTRGEKIDSANVIGTAGTMSSQSSSWVTVSRTSAGIYPIAFASGYYSGDPRCTVSLSDSSNGFIRFLGLPSNTGGSIVITNTTDTLNVDRNYTFQCMGPK